MGLSLNYTETGAGPPVVVLHGLFGSARNWTSIAKRMGETHRIFALDLRNHGDSPWADDMGFAAMAEDIAAFVRDHGLVRPVIIGHSLGGKAAMTYVLNHGDDVAGLVAVDIAPVRYEASFLPYVEAMRSVDLSGIERRADIDALLAPEITKPGVRAFLLQSLALGDTPRWRINLDVLASEMETMGGFPDFGAQTYQSPTLFLSGGQSRYVLPEHHAAIRALFPNTEFDTIEGAGHWVHAERPDEFIGRVAAFLATVRADQEAS